MDMEQKIEIPLSEYLELKELKEHEKLVKWEDATVHFHDGKASSQTTTGVQWKSDGAAWNTAVRKQQATTEKLTNIHRSLCRLFDDISNMSFRELRQFRKEVKKIIASEADGKAKAVHNFVEGW